MTQDLSQYVTEVLSGATMTAQAKLAGVHYNTLRREVLKHPDYASAKEQGKLRQSGPLGRPPKLRAEATSSPAVAEVIAGATTTATARKYGMPVNSLNKMVHMAHPGFSLQYRGKTQMEVLEEKGRKLRLELLKAAL